MEFKGRILKVMPVQTGTSANGGWRKKEFIFEYFEHDTDRWSDKVVLNAMNERIDEYDLHEGDEVRVGFSHGVKEYQGRWYPEFHIYKFEKVAAQTQPTINETPTAPAPEAAQEKKDDDLPF